MDRVALACYGPSLKMTWPRILADRGHGAKIATVSGAHDYLISRGIVPDFHVEYDDRPHKAVFVNKPHVDVLYLIASRCHPSVFDNLRGHKVETWDADEIGGGANVGLRAIALLYRKRFRNFAIFGIDCSFEGGNQHAGPHSGARQAIMSVTIAGRTFETNALFVTYAKQFLDTKRALKDARFVVHGDGLLQHVLRGGASL